MSKNNSIKWRTAIKHLKAAVSGSRKYIEIGDGDFLVTDKDTFGDNKEHEVYFIFFDGYAIGHAIVNEDEIMTLEMTYTKVADLTKDQKEKIQWYDGIDAPRSYTFRDIALYEGKVKLVRM